jgi:predicted RNA-binding protein (virulence factor B family)
MSLEDVLGRTNTLHVRRFAREGAYLALSPRPSQRDEPLLLLPRAEVSDDLEEGDALEVFVYLDSEDRPIATTARPALEVGEVGFLVVTDVTRYGAFVDWGLPKELLVPFKEQTRELAPGDYHPFGLLVDRSSRLAGTMRIREHLSYAGDFELDEWVDGEAWRNESGIGLFVILERRFIGLVPAAEPHGLRRGETASFRVSNMLPDGKIELSLRGRMHEELERDAEHIYALLCRPDAPRVSERSSPEQIRALFGLSKKAFKRAVGRLLKERAVTLDARSIIVPVSENDAARRGEKPPQAR